MTVWDSHPIGEIQRYDTGACTFGWEELWIET